MEDRLIDTLRRLLSKEKIESHDWLLVKTHVDLLADVAKEHITGPDNEYLAREIPQFTEAGAIKNLNQILAKDEREDSDWINIKILAEAISDFANQHAHRVVFVKEIEHYPDTLNPN